MTDIAQAVAAYNEQRKGLAATRSKAYGKQNWIFGALAVALVAVIFWCYRNGYSSAAFAVALLGVFALCIAFAMMRGSADEPGDELQRIMREQVFPALFSNIEGLQFQANTEGFYDEIPDGIKPSGDKFYWGDLIEGSYRGHPIALNEMRITKSQKTNDRTETIEVFKGLAIRTGLDQSVPDLIVKKGRMTVARWISEKLGTRGDTPHVAFDDETFEAAFDVHSANEGFARSVFSTAGRAKLLELQSSHNKSALRLAAMGQTVYVMLYHNKDFFELPSLDRSFNEGTDGRKLQDEMRGLLDLVDGVREMLEAGATEQFRL